ncbi:MAG: hypothetical protein EOO88_09620 [Pedobacter sp.]|nr:MAG: hypothetical protein EOO88_09620 [Pedobacter sp.]
MYIRFLLFIALTIVATSFKPLRSSKPVAISDRYLNDVDIEQDPDVLYTEHFNDGMDKIFSRYPDIKNRDGMSLDTEDTPPGSVSPAIKMTNNGSINDGGHLYKQFKPGFDSTVYLRYYVKYPSSSKGYIHHESVWIGGYNPGTSYPHPRAGTCGLGDKRISIAYEPVNAPAMDTYLYWGDMKYGANGKCYGNDLVNGSPTAQKLEWDKWMCVELMIKMNDPVSAYNGELKVWQDGKEVGHWGQGFPNGYWDADSWINDPSKSPFQGLRWRTDPDLKINYLWIEFYDDTTPAGKSHHIKFANLVMAKKYIGPIKD